MYEMNCELLWCRSRAAHSHCTRTRRGRTSASSNQIPSSSLSRDSTNYHTKHSFHSIINSKHFRNVPEFIVIKSNYRLIVQFRYRLISRGWFRQFDHITCARYAYSSFVIDVFSNQVIRIQTQNIREAWRVSFAKSWRRSEESECVSEWRQEQDISIQWQSCLIAWQSVAIKKCYKCSEFSNWNYLYICDWLLTYMFSIHREAKQHWVSVSHKST